ncbi:hypothetical protein HETIRDRAFT_53924 [Heterobasidion irregulare TC 32-1]|uniref:Acid phosphatase n=1 Tax=Heterobasidion irregulare (strain TC 32-1) TaxID=747525 RepID=W4JQN9_HETIT|nr:uncharacterized protein HETIRDRAFT_53924 [Heterobasidion irregulare TC 32-1]ETW75848.1 hypothetical protein HETIRDRAFT_53924 [Heterobasidion irregulare TC 32-1]
MVSPGTSLVGLGLGGGGNASGGGGGGARYRAPRPPLDVAGYPVAPRELELEQVHVYVRHGERTPVSVRMSDAPASIPEHWIMCKQARRFRAAVAGRDPHSPGELDVQRVVERADGEAVEGECLLGELTDVGRQSTYNYGRALRELYVDRLGFLPDTLARANDVYFRSTNLPRTIESLQQIVHGLYPTAKLESVVPQVRIRNGRDENLLGNTLSCSRLGHLLLNFANAAAAAYNHTLEPLDKKVAKYLGGNPIRLDGKPRASGVLDTIRAAMAHGVKVPPEFEERSVMDPIEKAVVNEWFAGYKTEEVRRLGMGRLLADLSRKMQLKAQELPASTSTSAGVVDEQARTPKILIHSTHDTALAGLASALDAFDDRWPAFTASITFELFRKREIQEPDAAAPAAPSQDRAHVRARYQNRTLVLPLCADEGKHMAGAPEFCTLEAFVERVDELTPRDWEAECAAGS